MTVGELMDKLQQLPPELTIVVEGCDDLPYENYEIESVKRERCEYITLSGIVRGNSVAIRLLTKQV